MQKRFWLKTFKETQLQDAYAEKKKLLEENPDRVYQIRKGRDGGRIVFRLVERLQTNEVIQLTNMNRGKKRGNRRSRPQVL